MSLKVHDVIGYLEEIAPASLALKWDNSGLLLGGGTATVNNLLVCLNYNLQVCREALEKEADLVISHHPLFLKPLQRIDTDTTLGFLIEKTLRHKLNLYTAHTNLDLAANGVSKVLLEKLALADAGPLQPYSAEPLEKLVVFVPESHLKKVEEALTEAGAGWIGGYSHCTFRVTGTGTFLPREGTKPFIGEKGLLQEVKEVRLETILPISLRGIVLEALIKAHPYEEVAYDIYPLKNEGRPAGLGRIGFLPSAITLEELTERIKKSLKVKVVKVVGERKKKVKKVALCGGSGGDLLALAKQAGVDVLVAGDIKYHQAEEAASLGLAVIDAGHDATEAPVVPWLASYLEERLEADGHRNKTYQSCLPTSYWEHM